MIVGVDFDNTLVCYDDLFRAAAVARGLMPADGPADKTGVREWFVQRGREDDFTLLQGEVYGPALGTAPPYSGALACLTRLKAAGETVYIVSHKTPTPALGPPYNLRLAAWEWLDANGFLTPGPIAGSDVFFEDTMEAKAARIASLNCTHFIDDMERFLLRPDFPAKTRRLRFNPAGNPTAAGLEGISSWHDAEELFLGENLRENDFSPHETPR